jgi:hypothetical protein
MKMGLKLTITIDGAKHLDIGVWMAKLEPDEVATLGKCENRSGPFSVLLLDSEVDYDEKTQTLTFNPNATCLLNIGSTAQILVLSSKDKNPVSKPIEAPSTPVKPPTSASSEPSGGKASTEEEPEEMTADTELSRQLATGDKLFLSELPADMRGLGETLLTEIRGIMPGELNFEPRSAKFDETPEIFWTIKILPTKTDLGNRPETGQIRLLGFSHHTRRTSSGRHHPPQASPEKHGIVRVRHDNLRNSGRESRKQMASFRQGR